MRGRRRLAVALLPVLALVLGACTGSSPGPQRPSTSRPVVSPQPSGVATQPAGTQPLLGAKPDWGRFGDERTYVAALGRGAPTFFELVWCDVEPEKGRQTWSAPDQAVDEAQGAGMTMMLKIRVGACWATGDQQATQARGRKTESFLPADLDAYTTFVTQVVTRYAARGVHVYAVENEPNSASFWGGSVAQLDTLVRLAARTIRRADPSARVSDVGISSTAYGAGIAQRLLDQGQGQAAVEAYDTYYARRFGTRGAQLTRVATVADLKNALGSAQGSRNLDYLELATQLAADKVVDIRQVHFYEGYDSTPVLMDYLHATTPTGVSLQVWEAGQFLRGGGLSAQQRSDEMVKTVADLLGRGASMVVWLPLRINPDGQNPDEPRYGLLDPDGSPRTAGRAFAALARAADGAQVRGVRTARAAGVVLTRDGVSRAFLWAVSGTVAVPAAVGTLAAADGSGGAPSDLDSGSPRQLTSRTSPDALVKALS